MAHMIDTTTGKAAIFVVGQAAWHKLGKVISAAVTSREAMHLALLDWIVEQEDIFLADGTKINGRKANVRSDTHGVLGVVGDGYKVFQNAEAFDFMDAIVGEKLAMFETAGAIKDGKTIWMLARIPKELRAAGDDVVNPYVLLTNSHDGTSALRMLPTSVRVVCNNTLNLALNRGQKMGFTMRHSEKLADRVEDAKQKLGMIVDRVDQFGEEMQALASVDLTEQQAKEYFQDLYPIKTDKVLSISEQAEVLIQDALMDAVLAQTARSMAKDSVNEARERQADRNQKIVEQLIANFHNERNTLPGIEGTAWAAFNAVSEYADHGTTVRGKTDKDRADNRMNSIFFGSANDQKQVAYEKVLELVKV